jgi:hypothetical protein
MSSAMQKRAGHPRTVTQIALLSAVAAGFALGCVSSSGGSSGTGGTTGVTGGAGTTAGGAAGASNTGLGGSTSAGGGSTGAGGSLPTATACPTPTVPLITNFAYTPTDAEVPPTEVTFGDFKTTFSGGTYIYPDASVVPTPAFPLTSDITGGNWHISGTVGTYSGFGLYWNACAELDASAFKGISLTLSGSVPANTLYISVSTAADTISTAWYEKYGTPPITPTFGTCNPPSSNQYDGSCSAPSKVISVPATPTPVTILWTDLTGGKPQPSVAPSQLTGISFYFSWSAGSFPVDLTIDNISFAQ